MCFSLLGRLHTRALSLIIPFFVTGVFIANTNQSDYGLLFLLMTVVGFALEIGLYYWLIEYQARWLSITLAVLEFLILKWIVELPVYPFEVHLRTRQALEFYFVAWLGSWATTQAILPMMFPRWAEEGGELLRSPSSLRTRRSSEVSEKKISEVSETSEIWAHRRSFLQSLVALFIITLPWSVSLWRTPPAQHFTGLLLMTDWHLAELTQASLVARGGEILSPAGVIGYIARQSFYSVLTVSNVIWIGASFMTLLGLSVLRNRDLLGFRGVRNLTGLALGAVCCLLLPVSTLTILAVVIWLGIIFLPNFRLASRKDITRVATLISSTLALTVWITVWVNSFTAPLVYLNEGEWQALQWLRKTSTQVVYAPEPFAKLIPALSGQETTHTRESATLMFSNECEAGVVFRNGEVCWVKVGSMSSTNGESNIDVQKNIFPVLLSTNIDRINEYALAPTFVYSFPHSLTRLKRGTQ